jgi:hypothetical protein
MTEPVDPNPAWQPQQPPAGYQPPPPFAPPGRAGYQPPFTPPGPAGSPPSPASGATSPAPGAPWPAPDATWPAPYPNPWVAEQAPGVWPPTPPPSHRRRNVLIIALVVVLVAAAGGYFALHNSDSSTDRLAIPAAFDGYTRLTNSNAGQVESSMRSMVRSVSGANKAFDAATIGIYGHDAGDTPQLITLALPAAAWPGASGNAAEQLTQGLREFGAGTQNYPPGRHGGTSICGGLNIGTVREVLCAWADRSTAGVVVSVLTPMTPARLSRIEREFRDQVD